MIGSRPIPELLRTITFADAVFGIVIFAMLFAGLWLLPDLSQPVGAHHAAREVR